MALPTSCAHNYTSSSWLLGNLSDEIWYAHFVSRGAGAGGGYNERENVEYISREDSEDEFDDVCLMCHVSR